VAALAQTAQPGAERMAVQREAMQRIAFMDGVWRGKAKTKMPSGETQEVTQTERIGPFLDDTIKLIEGRGYAADGGVAFTAFAVIWYDPDDATYTLRSYSSGQVGDFEFKPTATGFAWQIPVGNATLRYVSEISDNTWHQYGERIVPGSAPDRFFEMTLGRLRDTDWPAAGAIAAESD
jgi:hypothetical protein